MNLTSWIASKYLFSRRAGRYAPLLTVTSIAGVAAGMTALVIVMSVMSGFRQELTKRLVGFDAHVTLIRGPGAADLTKEDVAAIFDGEKVRDIAPFVQGEVIAESVTSGEMLAQGARLRGIDSANMGAMGSVDFYFPDDKSFTGAIVGNDIVGQLSVHPDFGDKIELIAPLAEVLPNGELSPNRKRFDVVGVFRAGIYDYDSKYILVDLDDARELLGLQAEEGYMVRLSEVTAIPTAMAVLKKRLPEGWTAVGLNEQNRKLFAALKLERIAMGSVLVMVVLIASFSIVGVVLLVTAAKRKDIAILESIGMTRRAIGRIFLGYASMIGAAGSFLGLVLGLGVCIVVKIWPIRLPESYYLDWLPVDISILPSVLFALIGVVIAALSSFYPVRQAMKPNPVEVLRYE